MSKIRRRPTKNQLIFRPINLLDALRLRYEAHKQLYRQAPKRIYLTQEEYDEYKIIVGKITNFRMSAFPLTFRGIELKIHE